MEESSRLHEEDSLPRPIPGLEKILRTLPAPLQTLFNRQKPLARPLTSGKLKLAPPVEAGRRHGVSPTTDGN